MPSRGRVSVGVSPPGTACGGIASPLFLASETTCPLHVSRERAASLQCVYSS